MSYSLDVNVLLYASDRSSDRHDAARAFLESCAAQPQVLCLTWPTLMAYLRIATHPSIFAAPLTPDEALNNVNALLSLPHARVDPWREHARRRGADLSQTAARREPLRLTNDTLRKMSPVLPDGTRIAYSAAAADGQTMDSWIVPVPGSQPRRLLANAEGLTWVPDPEPNGPGARPPLVLFSE